MFLEDEKREYRERISKAIRALGDRDAGWEGVDTASAEVMLVHAKCIAAILTGFIYRSGGGSGLIKPF